MKIITYLLILALLALSACRKFNIQSENEEQLAYGKIHMATSSFAPEGYSLVWEDNFENPTLNPDNWFSGCQDPITGIFTTEAKSAYNQSPDVYDGYNSSEDVYIQNGSLVLRGQKREMGQFHYSNGWVASMNRVHLNKGYIEIRAKLPKGDKVYPTFWLLAEDRVWGPEWDMWEYFGQKDVRHDIMGSHLMTGLYSDSSNKWDTSFIPRFDTTHVCANWHVYGFEWTANYAKWYLDGNEIRTLYPNSPNVVEWPNEEMFLILNNGQRTESEDHNTIWPNYVEIDYVRIYQKFNGDFESGSTDPWFKYGNTSISSTNQHAGSYCAYIGDDNSGYEYVVTGLKPNTSYTFRGNVKLAGYDQRANIGVKEYGGTEIKASTISTGYMPLSVTFTTGATNTSAKLCFYRYSDGPGAAYGDDFELFYTPVASNNGFETGLPAPWFNFGTTSILNSSTMAHSGNYCAYIGADNSGYEYVVSGLKPNTNYTFCGYIKGQPANIGAKEFGGAEVGASTPNTDYTFKYVKFTTGATNTTAKLDFYRWANGPGVAYGDDFTIYETPIVPNGNFESGISPWFNYGTSFINSDNQYHSGPSCAYVGAENSGFEYMVSGLKPNTRYIFQGYVKAATSGQGGKIGVKEFGGTEVADSTHNLGYTLLSVSFTTGATNTSAKVCFYGAPNGFSEAYGDDFEILEDLP